MLRRAKESNELCNLPMEKFTRRILKGLSGPYPARKVKRVDKCIFHGTNVFPISVLSLVSCMSKRRFALQGSFKEQRSLFLFDCQN